MFRALSQNGRLFGKCFCDYVASFSFSVFTDELHEKGREKCISNGGGIIIDNYDYGDGDDENEYGAVVGSEHVDRTLFTFDRANRFGAASCFSVPRVNA